MATLKKFTVVDPNARVNLTLKESTRRALEQYRLYYHKTYGDPVERSELVEQLLVAWMEQDKEYQKFVEGLSAQQKAEIERVITKDNAPPALRPTGTA